MANGFDYIIVGSGSAGAVLAARLSENEDVRVLLLEAGGPDQHPLQVMPLAVAKVIHSRRYNWNYETEPEPGLNGRRLPVARGKTLGGSSSINAMICIRGNRADYDLWAQSGLDGWSYADVLPYFKRLESNWRGETAYHGASGPIRVSPMAIPDMLYEPIRQAAVAMGIPDNDDPNGATQDGVSRVDATIGDGKRASTARTYLRPAKGRPNLTIEMRALATRVIVERGRAVGVEYVQRGQTVVVRAEREVVLSGGTYNSPQLLMLSGIGPADHLREVGITPIHDLPGVGQNLQEHPNFTSLHAFRKPAGLTQYLRFDRAMATVTRWYLRHDGPFATNATTANLFVRTKAGLARPDMQITLMPLSNTAKLWFPHVTAPPLHCFSTRIGVLHPYSRGWVKLRSADPAEKPRILKNIFKEPEDLDTMVRGFRICRELFAQAPLKDMVERETFPGDSVIGDAELGEVIRREATHRAHPVGTCRMGFDPEAVVDAELKVHGIDGLRIADASIMPDMPSGNTNVPSIMVGEKAADLMRGLRLPRAELS